MKNWKASLVEFLTAIVLAVLILALVPAVARAAGDMPPPEQRGEYQSYDAEKNCNKLTGNCVVPFEFLANLANANVEMDNLLRQALPVMKRQAAVIEQFETEVKRLRDMKGCGRLEVAPPARGGKS